MRREPLLEATDKRDKSCGIGHKAKSYDFFWQSKIQSRQLIKKTILVNNIANQGRNKIIYPKINKILYILFIKYQITKRLSFGWEM